MMGRMVKNWTPIKVEEIEVAPHRYRWDGAVGADGNRLGDIALADDFRAARACIPYKEGEVVYIERGDKAVRALIYRAAIGRDRYGDRREWYNVQPETASGTFSKLWERVHPGFIQRGYQRAGLAPEIPS